MDFTKPRKLLGINYEGHLDSLIFSPDGQTIAFSYNSWRGGSFIGLKNRDGSGKAVRVVSAGRTASGRPRDDEYKRLQFTPDGKSLLYNFLEDDQAFSSIWLVDVTTGEQTRLTESNEVWHLSLSPDGKYITFGIWEQGRIELYRMTIKGQDIAALPLLPVVGPIHEKDLYLPGNTSPVYSPDCQHIAFLSTDYNEKRGDTHQVCVMRSNGREIQCLTQFPGDCDNPVWHPNGEQIAFTNQAAPDAGIERSLWKYRTNLYLINADSSGLRRLENGNSVNSIGGFSPDGRWIVYMSTGEERFKEGWRNWDIYLLDVESDQIHILTENDLYNNNPVFSPDGRSILFATERGLHDGCDLHLIDIEP